MSFYRREVKRFGLWLCVVVFWPLPQSLSAQGLRMAQADDAIVFLEGKDSVLVYQAGEISHNGSYGRSNYVHPLYAPNGNWITEDFPEDHPHQRGIFWAWHQLYQGDRQLGDGWALENFSYEVAAVELMDSVSTTKALRSQVYWKNKKHDANGVADDKWVREDLVLSVWPITKGVRAIDFDIRLWALKDSMRLGGSMDAKGYGGFSARIKVGPATVFTNDKGHVTPEEGPVSASRYMQFHQNAGKAQDRYGLTLIPHRDNPGFPNPWILRQERSMQNAVFPFPGRQAVALDKTEPLQLRYRLLVHDRALPHHTIKGYVDAYDQMAPNFPETEFKDRR